LEKYINTYFPAFHKAEELITHLQKLKYTKPEDEKGVVFVENEMTHCNEEMLEFIKSTKARLLQKILNYEKANII
jgi:hypothetical protein